LLSSGQWANPGFTWKIVIKTVCGVAECKGKNIIKTGPYLPMM